VNYEPVIGLAGVRLWGGASFWSFGLGLFTLGKAFRIPWPSIGRERYHDLPLVGKGGMERTLKTKLLGSAGFT